VTFLSVRPSFVRPSGGRIMRSEHLSLYSESFACRLAEESVLANLALAVAETAAR